MRAETTHVSSESDVEAGASATLTETERHTAPSLGFVTLDELDRRHIRAVLEACGGNKSEAARVLGISRRNVYRWLARMGDK